LPWSQGIGAGLFTRDWGLIEFLPLLLPFVLFWAFLDAGLAWVVAALLEEQFPRSLRLRRIGLGLVLLLCVVIAVRTPYFFAGHRDIEGNLVESYRSMLWPPADAPPCGR